MEVYHVQSIHPETVHTGLDYTGNVNTFYPNGHGRMVAPSRTFPDLPEVALKANPDALKQANGKKGKPSKYYKNQTYKVEDNRPEIETCGYICLLYTSPSPRD